MNSTLRWNLLLGCVVLAVIQLPNDAEVLAHDLQGPYCASASAGACTTSGPSDDAESATWQTAMNEFDPAHIGADSEALLEDVDTSDRGDGHGGDDH
ncbi:MAG: hypothetical protein IPJ77_11490 [Planctomycetes bacterium]|nr:hypothetical protein [Planctomycetota bacterium]